MGIFGKKKNEDDFVLQLFGSGWENTGQIYLDPENDKKKKKTYENGTLRKEFCFLFFRVFFFFFFFFLVLFTKKNFVCCQD